MMAQAKPKLMVLDTPELPAEELQRILSDRFEVVVAGSPAASGGPEPPSDGEAGANPAMAPSPQNQSNPPDLTRALLNSLGEGVCLVRPDGSVDLANQAFQNLDEHVRQSVRDACREALPYLGRPGAGPASRTIRVEDDAPRWYQVEVSPLQGGAGAAVAVRDITGAKLRELRFATIERAGRELVRLEPDTVRRMNALERLALLEEKVIRSAHELLNFDHFAVRLVDRRTGKLELVFSCGLSAEAGEFDLYPSTEGNGISGYVAATGRSYLCPDASRDPRFLPALAESQSSLVVPLHLNDKVIGVLDVESLEPNAFTDDDVHFAEVFAGYIAMALNMLDLLVVERSTTNETVTGRVEGELSEPLEDIAREAEGLTTALTDDPDMSRRLERIKKDVEAIRSRMREVAKGPQTLLGIDRAMSDHRRDPLLVGRRVLVADDAPKVRRIIGDVLRNRGAEVVSCESGSAAIRAVENAAAGNGPPVDLIVSDIKMPDRNGYEVFAAANRALPGVRVILMTGFGYDPHHSIVRASQEGLQSVLFKPFQVERLLEEVRRALAGEDSPGRDDQNDPNG